MKKLITTTAVILSLAAATAGCGTSSGKRSGKPVYGPGSTGNLGSTSGSTGGGGGGGTGTGAFSSAPALNNPRAQHTATTLADGRVLVVGGTDGQGTYKDAEVFDPTANAWTPIASLLSTNGVDTARQLHTATLLSNNQVLIAGGLGVENAQNQFSAMQTCFLFDPTSDTFTATGNLPHAVGWHQASVLSNGTVMVAGGVDANIVTVKNSATFDPASGQWTARGNSGAHSLGVMLTAGQKTILVGGGELALNQQNQPALAGFATPPVELFDVQGGTWGQGPNNVGERIYYAGATNSIGKALFAGGYNQQGSVDTTEVYDGAQNTFTPGPTLAVARDSAEIAEIGNSGDMLVISGMDGSGAPTPVCEVILMNSNVNAGQASMATARIDHKAVTLKDGRILVIGGSDANGSLDTCEFYTR